MATNSLGVAAEEVEVSGRPLAPSMLHGGPPHPSQTEYTLRWRKCALKPLINLYYKDKALHSFPECGFEGLK